MTTWQKQRCQGPVAARGGYRNRSLPADRLSATNHKIIGHLYPRIRSERPAFDLQYPHIQSGRPRAPAAVGASARPRDQNRGD